MQIDFISTYGTDAFSLWNVDGRMAVRTFNIESHSLCLLFCSLQSSFFDYGADPAELEQLRQNNQLLRKWFSLLADRKRDLMDIQQSLAKARNGRDDAKAQYMAAKASYGKMCDYVRSFEDLALRVQNEINNCIDQIQLVALATPSMDETLNTMLDEMAQQMLAAGNK